MTKSVLVGTGCRLRWQGQYAVLHRQRAEASLLHCRCHLLVRRQACSATDGLLTLVGPVESAAVTPHTTAGLGQEDTKPLDKTMSNLHFLQVLQLCLLHGSHQHLMIQADYPLHTCDELRRVLVVHLALAEHGSRMPPYAVNGSPFCSGCTDSLVPISLTSSRMVRLL